MKKYDLNDLLMTLFIIIIFCIMILIYNAGFAFFDYIIYKTNNHEYELVDGTIIDLNYMDILPARGSLDRGAIYYTKAGVSYEINGEKYFAYNIKSFSDKEKGDKVLLAIKDSKVLRGELYKFSYVELLMIFFALTCLLLMILIGFYRMKQNVKTRVLNEIKCINYQKELDENKQNKVFEKQKYILKKVEGNRNDKKGYDTIKILNNNEIFLNEECIWYINNGIYIRGILINEFNDSINNCVLVTKKMREKGLGMNFYVIEEFDDFCLCCSSKYKKVYSYSENLGITNTKYFDFYDYVIERIKKTGE